MHHLNMRALVTAKLPAVIANLIVFSAALKEGFVGLVLYAIFAFRPNIAFQPNIALLPGAMSAFPPGAMTTPR